MRGAARTRPFVSNLHEPSSQRASCRLGDGARDAPGAHRRASRVAAAMRTGAGAAATHAVLAILTALAVVAVHTAGCSREDARVRPPTDTRVLLIGLDGLEWNVVLEMLREDDAGAGSVSSLPALADLMERGVFGLLEPTRPTLSPIIWTSIATGVTADRHGIRGFVHGEPRDGRPARLYTSRDRTAKAFWNILTDAGIASVTVGWWNTFPVEPVAGTMVAQVNTISPRQRRRGLGIWKGELVADLEGQVHPPELEARLLSMLPGSGAAADDVVAAVLGAERAADELSGVPAALLEQSRWAFRADAIYREVALHILRAREEPARMAAVYFGGADVVGHRFWRYAEPDSFEHPPSAAETAQLGGIIRRYYAYLDGIVGELVAAMGADVNVFVISDHGMNATARHARFLRPQLSGGHLDAPPAFLVAAGPQIRAAGHPLPRAAADRSALATHGTILDILPTLLALLGVPVARDMPGSVLTSVVEPQFLTRHPPRSVASHTDTAWLEKQRAAPAPVLHQIERLEQLRALGYVD